MYFPYVRGKQFELLALKELSPVLGSDAMTMPIIEPVREPRGSGLERCLTSLDRHDVRSILIVNPAVGNLRSESISQSLVEFVSSTTLSGKWILGLLLDQATDIGRLFDEYRMSFEGCPAEMALIHRSATHVAQIESVSSGLPRSFDVVDDRLRARHFRPLLRSSSGVTMRDGFPAENRNSDYLGKAESVFTEDHLYFADEGWFGFSDFLTIGDAYVEGGFTPRAVAIHWTYEPAPGLPIMVRHFTSESNSDTSDVGGKFLEAASKLYDFIVLQDITTKAAEAMRSYVESSTYPGLGIVKKLSMQNHLELVSSILARK